MILDSLKVSALFAGIDPAHLDGGPLDPRVAVTELLAGIRPRPRR